MRNQEIGGTYLETLIALFLLLIVLNPLFFSLIYLKRGFNYIDEVNKIENEIEKARSYYKIAENKDSFFICDKNYKIEIKKNRVFEEIYLIEIKIEKNKLKRESKLYVYKQK
ncbi:hypothetical protein NON08_05200 [Cetobacterium somerae]|uniref:hypothetical protein n=1 Tax=Cetobacterium sp. NK01 TaxID=2993530 RepID=UPI002116065F|nr:hypothetical protein [Cetobacterium sp. NK01]MCQ8211924.1 hypothetical protein [Cetobacterium sp. NK01]